MGTERVNLFAVGKFDDVVSQSNSWKSASGTRTDYTIGVTDALVPRWVIFRDNLAGLRLNVGTKISGTKTASGIVVLNKDGSDPAEYNFIKIYVGGKPAFVNVDSVKADKVYNPQTKQMEAVPNSWEVTSNTYPFFTETIIDPFRDGATKLPANYELTGEVVSVKTRTDSSGYLGMKDVDYLKTNVSGTEYYVPVDALRKKGGKRDIGTSTDVVLNAPTPTSTEDDVPSGIPTSTKIIGVVLVLVLGAGILMNVNNGKGK